jgi:hypothetical protein
MFQERTVLVLGAGASIPFGFPSGPRLTKEIIDNLAADSPLRRQMYTAFGDQKVNTFQNALKLSDHRSIDAFLEHRSEFFDVGKGAIACALLPCEKRANLFTGGASWYGYLLDRLPMRFEELKDRLAVVTFNYDRTLRYYLLNAISNRYNLPVVEAAKWLEYLPIIHVYGSLGELPIENLVGGPTAVAFGEEPSPTTIQRSIGQLRIMHDREESNPWLDKAHGLLRRAERVIFLGFGYDPTNLKRLLRYGPTEVQAFIGSAHDMTDAEARLVERRLKECGCKSTSQPDWQTGETLGFLRKHCWFD